MRLSLKYLYIKNDAHFFPPLTFPVGLSRKRNTKFFPEKMRMPFFITTLILCYIIAHINCYPEGAPSDACDSLRPSHEEHQPSATSAPYSITTSKNRISSSETLTVTITGLRGSTFKGFLIVARNSDGDSTNLGQFIASTNAHAMTCSTTDVSIGRETCD